MHILWSIPFSTLFLFLFNPFGYSCFFSWMFIQQSMFIECEMKQLCCLSPFQMAEILFLRLTLTSFQKGRKKKREGGKKTALEMCKTPLTESRPPNPISSHISRRENAEILTCLLTNAVTIFQNRWCSEKNIYMKMEKASQRAINQLFDLIWLFYYFIFTSSCLVADVRSDI